jgi:hypothetical protein
MASTPDIPLRYIYLDSEGIESLYVQIVERNIIETVSKRGSTKRGKISGRIGLGKILGPFLKLADIEVSPELEGSSNAETTTKSALSVEHKLSELTKHLDKHGEPSVFMNLTRAEEYCTDNHEAVFVNIKDTFDAPQFYDGRGPLEVNESQAILFNKNVVPKDTYDYGDDYYKKPKASQSPILMASSIHKYPSLKNGSMGLTSHLALMFRQCGGLDIPLGVFGAFFHVGSAFQIKPYAIWR